MQSSHSNYLKLAFTNAELLKHIQFQAIKRKQAHLQFYIHAQYIDHSTKNIISLPAVKLSEIMTNEGSMFYPKSNRWDCILFQQKGEGSNKSLKLKFQICENQKHSYTSALKSIALLTLSEEDFKSRVNAEESKEMIQGEPDNGQTEKSRKIAVVDLSFQSPQIVIPLQKFLRQPYKIHQISLDFYIPPQHKTMYRVSSRMTLQAETKAQTARKQSKQRDGMLNFQLVFLPKTRTELRFHNFRLKTRSFAKHYKLFVCQVLRQQPQENNSSIKRLPQDEANYASTIYMKSVFQQLLKQKNVVSKLQVPLQVSGWQVYQNQLSFVSPLILPMIIKNNLDQIQFLLEYESTETNKQQSQKQQTSIVTLSKVISVDYFYKKKQNLSKMTKQIIFFHNKIQTFELQFDFEILLEKGLESTAPNLRSTETVLQQFGEQEYLGLQSKVDNVLS